MRPPMKVANLTSQQTQLSWFESEKHKFAILPKTAPHYYLNLDPYGFVKEEGESSI